MNPRALLAKYRTQLLVGLGGLAAFFAYRSRTEQAAAAQAAAAAAAGPAQLVPGDTSGALVSGINIGAGLYGQGVSAGLAPTETALGLAGQAVGGSAALAQSAASLAAGISGDWAGLGSQLIGALTGLLTPVPAPIAQPPPAPPPATTPPPATPAAETFTGYEVYVGSLPPNTIIKGFLVSSSGVLTPRGLNVGTGNSWAPVARLVTAGRLHWRMTSGYWTGVSYVPGLSTGGAWGIRKRIRRGDGSSYTQPISPSGS